MKTALGAALLTAALALCACGTSAPSSADARATAADAADVDAQVWQNLEHYLAVIRAGDAPVGPRTGTDTDRAVHEWMRDQLAATPGLQDMQVQSFAFPQFVPHRYSLSVQTADGAFSPQVFPWFYQGRTDDNGVSGTLRVISDSPTQDDLTGAIVYFQSRLAFNSESGAAQRTLDAAQQAGAVGAIVSFSNAPADQIPAQNYDSAQGYRHLPTLVVSGNDGARIAAAAGSMAQLVLTADEVQGHSQNVAALLPGSDPSRMLVVATPMTGWLLSGGERGPGVGGLLYLARYYAAQAQAGHPPPVSIWFAVTGAHEVYGFGVERFLSCLPLDQVAAYVHLGSGLVSRRYDHSGAPTDSLSQNRTLSVSENPLLQKIAAQRFLAQTDLQPLFDLPPSLFDPGEARVAYAQGIPMLSLSGTNPYHHTAGDDESQILRGALAPMILAYRNAIDDLLALDPATLRAANAASGPVAQDPGYGCAAPLSGV